MRYDPMKTEDSTRTLNPPRLPNLSTQSRSYPAAGCQTFPQKPEHSGASSYSDRPRRGRRRSLQPRSRVEMPPRTVEWSLSSRMRLHATPSLRSRRVRSNQHWKRRLTSLTLTSSFIPPFTTSPVRVPFTNMTVLGSSTSFRVIQLSCALFDLAFRAFLRHRQHETCLQCIQNIHITQPVRILSALVEW